MNAHEQAARFAKAGAIIRQLRAAYAELGLPISERALNPRTLQLAAINAGVRPPSSKTVELIRELLFAEERGIADAEITQVARRPS